MREFLAQRAARLDTAAELAESRSPQRILRLGFALVRCGGKTVRSAAAVGPGDRLDIELADGTIRAEAKRPHTHPHRAAPTVPIHQPTEEDNELWLKSEISYSEASAEIERILARFRNEEMEVDTLAAEVRRATEMIALCRKKLPGPRRR